MSVMDIDPVYPIRGHYTQVGGGQVWNEDVGSLSTAEGMTVQAAIDLAHMDCDVFKDDVRQVATECKAGPCKVPRGTSEEKETGDG